MPEHELPLLVCLQELENQTLLAEGMFFPEASCLGRQKASVLRQLQRRMTEVLGELSADEVYRRLPAGPFEQGVLEFEYEPGERTAVWRNPLKLRFPYVQWRHGNEACLAYVPALGIEVVTREPEALAKLLESEARSALSRLQASGSLRRVVALQQAESLIVEPLPTVVDVPTPKQRALADERAQEKKASVLEEIGTDLSQGSLPPAFEMAETVQKLAESLRAAPPKSVLLVGESGVGKTAAVHEVVRRHGELGLGAWKFFSTSGSRLIAGMSGFGLWQQRCMALVKETARQQVLLHVESLTELIEVGKGGGHTQGIAAFLVPYIVRGNLVLVAECTPHELPIIERESPQLLEALHQLPVAAPSAEQGRSILLSFALHASRGQDLIEPEALEAIDRLHRRYARYSAWPGRPLRFVRNLLEDRPDGEPLAPAEVTRAFSEETGLPAVLLEDEAPLDLEQTHAWLSQRVVGQPEAVRLAVDLLATIKAGLARPGRPLASLLFIGPTGVGKTEMAKALAQFLYSDAGRLVRFDMSEYADPLAVERLVGGSGRSQGLLTAKVREQPFQVLLFDEFEKAHPQFFDLLLQVLGEGRLTDAAGRVADFTNAVVIMTSNLAAESYERPGVGFQDTRLEAGGAQAHFERQVREFLRPEMYNRIDRVVPFAPLSEETLLQIAASQLQALRQREGLQFRDVRLTLDDAVTRWLATEGWAPKYGARPLRRAIERRLLAPLADRIIPYAGHISLDAQVRLAGEQLDIDVKARLDGAGRVVCRSAPEGGSVEAAQAVCEQRRKAQRLDGSPRVLALRNELYRLEQAERLSRRKAKARGLPEEAFAWMPRKAELERLAQSVEQLLRESCELEDKTLVALYQQRPLDAGAGAAAEALWQRTQAIALDILLFDSSLPSMYSLVIFSEHPQRLVKLAAGYYELCRAAGALPVLYEVRPVRASDPREPNLKLLPPPAQAAKPGRKPGVLGLWRIDHAEAYWASPGGDFLGLAFQVGGARELYRRLEPEAGLHVFVDGDSSEACLVNVAPSPLLLYTPPEGVDRRGAIGSQPRRRSYHVKQQRVLDHQLHRWLYWSDGDLARLLTDAADEFADRQLWALFE